MIQEKLIEFDTAKLASEKGYSKSVYNHEHNEEEWKRFGEKIKEIYFPFPTQSLLQKWLREEHNIDVYPLREYSKNKMYSIEMVMEIEGNLNVINPGELHEVYENALEEGLFIALKQLPNAEDTLNKE